LINASLAGDLPQGTGSEFPQNLARTDTVQSACTHGEYKGRFTVINGGRID
jgi:hypothetical protein